MLAMERALEKKKKELLAIETVWLVNSFGEITIWEYRFKPGLTLYMQYLYKGGVGNFYFFKGESDNGVKITKERAIFLLAHPEEGLMEELL